MIPQQENLEFLFIGTFNPVWDAANGKNADYFYGRASSLFWCILPHAFNENCLIDQGPEQWEAFCTNHNIGLTDIISSVLNGNENDEEHNDLLCRGFQDKNLDKKIDRQYVFNLDFTTHQIIRLISQNRRTLKAVFFTRSTPGEIPRIWSQWQLILLHCQNLGIYANGLPTPSTRGGTIRDKIALWRQEVGNSL
ncbi:hypothetical protein DN068_11945 [Taibaiella soli]|uniref:Uracil-DNA glycosylase-like domain-containing protein n=1 Tax=Taibaiella soli TaxID=1649169 RepID=A0A2W2AJZ9_9BACT|nr:hypothetical protein DN068_11945 [Taibaiella soli]